MSDKLTRAQQHVVERMKTGYCLIVAPYTKGGSLTKRYCERENVAWRTIEALILCGVIREIKNRDFSEHGEHYGEVRVYQLTNPLR